MGERTMVRCVRGMHSNHSTTCAPHRSLLTKTQLKRVQRQCIHRFTSSTSFTPFWQQQVSNMLEQGQQKIDNIGDLEKKEKEKWKLQTAMKSQSMRFRTCCCRGVPRTRPRCPFFVYTSLNCPCLGWCRKGLGWAFQVDQRITTKTKQGWKKFDKVNSTSY